MFSVKKMIELLIVEGERGMDYDFDKIWKIKVPPRVKAFLWMMSIGRIPTK